jgi:hypothetical protein
MNIKHLKAGDKVILRRINRYGRYEYSRATISKIAAGNAVAGVGSSFNRDTGKENGYLIPPQLSKWEAFPADFEIVKLELDDWEKGKRTQVVSPERVKLIRCLERIRNIRPEDVEATFAFHIIKAVGQPGDYVETDE